MDNHTLRYAERHALVGRHEVIDHLRGGLIAGPTSVVVLTGAPGVGKTAIASRLLEMAHGGALSGRFTRGVIISLFQESWSQTLPRLAEEVLGASVVLKATQDELEGLLIEHCRAHKLLVVVDNFDSARSDGSGFLSRWVDQVQAEASVLVVTAINGPDLQGARVQRIELSGLASKRDQLDLVGPELRTQLGDAALGRLLPRLAGVPLSLLYLRWQNPPTPEALERTVDGLARNRLNREQSIVQVLSELEVAAVPFLALGVVRQLQFPEALLAFFFDCMGGGNTSAYVSYRDRLVENRLITPVPGQTSPTYRLSEEVHTHLLRAVIDALGQNRLPTLHYFASDYYRRLFEQDRLGSLQALEGFVYHCREEGDLKRALDYVLKGDLLEDLHRAGLALHLQAVLEAFLDADELTELTFERRVAEFTLATWCDDTSKCRVLLELAHVYSDLSDFPRCLVATEHADRMSDALPPGPYRDQFSQAVWYYKAVSHSNLGESDQCLRAYFRVVSGTKPMDRRSCLSFGYLAHDLKYRDLDAADRLGAEAVVAARELGDDQILAKNLCSHAETEMFRNDFDAAEASFVEAEALTDDSAGSSLDRRELGRIRMNFGALRLVLRDDGPAQALIADGRTISRNGGDRRRAATADLYLGILAHHQGDFDERDALAAQAVNSLADQGDGRYLVPAVFCQAYWLTEDSAVTRSALEGLARSDETLAIARRIGGDDRFEVFARFWREHFHRLFLAR